MRHGWYARRSRCRRFLATVGIFSVWRLAGLSVRPCFQALLIQNRLMDIQFAPERERIAGPCPHTGRGPETVRRQPIDSAYKRTLTIEARTLTARVHTPTWAALGWPLHVAITMDLGEMKVFRSSVKLGDATAADFDAICSAVRLVPCCACGTATFAAAAYEKEGDEVCMQCICKDAIDAGALIGSRPIDQKEYDKRLLARINANNRKRAGEASER